MVNVVHIDSAQTPLQRQLRRRMAAFDPPLSARALSLMAGKSEKTVTAILDGRSRNPRHDTLQALARVLGCTVDDLLIGHEIDKKGSYPETAVAKIVGRVRTFDMLDRPTWPPAEQRRIELPVHPAYADLPRFALEVADDSMDEIYPPGSILVCVPVSALTTPPEPGDRVIVENWLNGRVEITCREITVLPDGRLWLVPRSRNPEYRTTGQPWDPEAGKNDARRAAEPAAAFVDAPGARPRRTSPDGGPYVTALVVISARLERDRSP